MRERHTERGELISSVGLRFLTEFRRSTADIFFKQLVKIARTVKTDASGKIGNGFVVSLALDHDITGLKDPVSCKIFKRREADRTFKEPAALAL